MEEEDFSLQMESVIRGHHVYKFIWTPSVGQILSLSREDGNVHNPYSVSVLKDAAIVGHAPRELS